MARIFISAGHGGNEGGRVDPGAVAGGTTEAEQMIKLRDQIVPELSSRRYEVLSVPDSLSLRGTLDWINARQRKGDIALEIHADAFSNPSVRGTSCFYIAGNNERKQHAELILKALIRRLPSLPNRGAKPDTAAAVGRLAFCRDIICPSLLLEVGFLTNPEDRALMIERRRDMAIGIADGLAEWSFDVAGGTPPGTPPPVTPPPGPVTYPTINILINNQTYRGQGILINSNAYIPIDLVDMFRVDLTKKPGIRTVQYGGIVYVKAVELREYNISVGWDAATRTVVIRTILSICPGHIDRIMAQGNTTEVQLNLFLKSVNSAALNTFPDLPKIYREESAIEGVNYDIAFCQMCLETSFLRFGGDVKPSQNNFAGLGAIGGGAQGATFSSARIGVRAHVQHLKAYASLEPLVQELVDPRFNFVTRGVAPLLNQLSGRWAVDPQYGAKIMAILRRLYESAGLL